jgi:FkbM family methyltransferase
MCEVSLRTRLFQWITSHFPTRRLHHAKPLRAAYRLRLDTIRPPGEIVISTEDYKFRFRRRPKKNLAWQTAIKRSYEPFETQTFRGFLAPGVHIMDIGANFGHYAMVASPIVAPEGRVFAFEPVPALFSELSINRELNGFLNISPIMKAVGEKEGTLDLYLDEQNSGGHSFGKSNVDTLEETITVEVVTVDNFVKTTLKGAPLGIIKMDTQGAEGGIIAGAMDTLRDHKPVVLMEFWPFGMRACGFDAEQVLQTLQGFGYSFQLVSESERTLARITASRLLELFPAADKEAFGNILATIQA